MCENVTTPEPPSEVFVQNEGERSWTKWLPTNKWWAATVVATGTVVTLAWTAGIHTSDDKALVVGLIVQRLVAYITRN